MEYDWKKEEEFEESIAAITSLVDFRKLVDSRIESENDSIAGEMQCNLARIISQAISISLGEPLLQPKKWCPDSDVIQDVDGWLNITYTIDIKKAIRKAIRLFNRSAELGYRTGYYYLSELGRVLSEHYAAWKGDYDVGDTPPPEALLYEKYTQLYNEAFDHALSLDEPHALYTEAFVEYDYYRNFDDKDRSDMLLRAATAGYPPAVYEYALKIRETRPKEADEMIESVSWSRRVRSLMAWHERGEDEELDSQYEFDNEELEPKLSDFYDDIEELELNTRGDGFD